MAKKREIENRELLFTAPKGWLKVATDREEVLQDFLISLSLNMVFTGMDRLIKNGFKSGAKSIVEETADSVSDVVGRELKDNITDGIEDRLTREAGETAERELKQGSKEILGDVPIPKGGTTPEVGSVPIAES